MLISHELGQLAINFLYRYNRNLSWRGDREEVILFTERAKVSNKRLVQ